MPQRTVMVRQMFWRVAASLLFCWLSLPTTSAGAGQERPPGPEERPATASVLTDSHNEDALAHEVNALVLRLDAVQFSERNEATRQLLAKGSPCVPLLVDALGTDSREARFRVAGILRNSFSFDDIAPSLVGALDKKYGSEARLILRDRSLLQVAEAAEMENTKKSFTFWGTDIEALRRRVLFDLMDARGPEQAGHVVAPLIGLRSKAEHFDKILSRLTDLSLPFDHRHSPGFLMAETLAQGLLHDNQKQIAFTHQYVESLETLAQRLQGEELTRGTIRKEIGDRANMSDGAAVFLERLLDEQSKEYQTLTQRLNVSPAMVQSEFFRGLTLPDTKECFRCIGKVHIADMLLETLDKWPAAPDDGVVGNVIDCVVTTISSGDKPKALGLLDALEGCAGLASHKLDVRAGVGERLAKRLCLAAQVAPNSREYHPVRAIHDRLVRLIDLGIQADQALFPSDFVSRYLEGDPTSVEEDARAALGRYVHIIEELGEANESLDQTGVQQFLQLMVANLSDGQKLLETGSAEVTELLDRKKRDAVESSSLSIDAALAAWAAEQQAAATR